MLNLKQAPEILNNVALQEVLAFQRGSKHKDKDIERPNTAIAHIKSRADEINKELAEKLQVRQCLLLLHSTHPFYRLFLDGSQFHTMVGRQTQCAHISECLRTTLPMTGNWNANFCHLMSLKEVIRAKTRLLICTEF